MADHDRIGANFGAPDGWQPCTGETEHCKFDSWQKDYLVPPCCAAHLQTVLAFTEDLLARHGIVHFLDYGTLLGAVRSQSLIPWDSDGDFSFLSADLPRVLALETETETAGFWFDSRKQPSLLRIHYSRVNRMHVDLWFHGVENGIAKCDYGSERAKWYFPADIFSNLGEVTLHGKNYPAPAAVETFLSRYRYGPDFMTPRRIEGWRGWLGRMPRTPAFDRALEDIRDREYRAWILETALRRRTQADRPASNRPASWKFRLTRHVPEWVISAHRALWKIRLRLAGPIPDATPELLDLLYEIHRRELVIGILERSLKENAP